MDTLSEFLLSSPAKAMTAGEEKMGDITGVTSKKTEAMAEGKVFNYSI